MKDDAANQPNSPKAVQDLRGEELALRLAEHVHDTNVTHKAYDVVVHGQPWNVVVRREAPGTAAESFQ